MSGATSRGFGAALLRFSLVQAVVVMVLAFGLIRFVWGSPAEAGAVRASAWLAVGVQVVTFAIARLVAGQNIMAGWGLGVLLRFATVVMWSFLGIKALGLAAGPALLSIVLFFFVSTLIEPLFLNA